VKPLVIAPIIAIASSLTPAAAHAGGGAQEKRFVMEMRQNDGTVSGVELVVARPEDAERSPMDLLKKQVGLKWSGFRGGVVYRFNQRSQTWESIMFRDIGSTETRIGEISGLKISELKSGDVLVLYPPSP
jgi:hypothetical protein